MIYNCKTYKDSPKFLKNSSIVFGVFDGLHEGHLFQIEEAIKDNKKTYAVTFDIDPDELFHERFKKLMDNEDRIEALNNTNIDGVVVLPFREVKDIKAIDFLNGFFAKHTPYSIHIGENFNFGLNRAGNVELLKEWGQKNNMKVFVHELLKKDGKVISSTNLRKSIC